MSTTKTADRFAKFTKAADTILTQLQPTFTSLTAGVQKLAVLVVDVRASIDRSVTSKKTTKAVTVKDWDGRSPEYREWYNDVLLPMIEQRIPTEYQATIRTRLQNQVQEEMHRRATPAQKAHLGLKAVSKGDTRRAKNAAKKTASTPSARPSDESFTTDALVAFVKDTPIQDAAQAIAAQCEALVARVKAKDNGLTPVQSKKSAALLAQAMQYLMSARSTLVPAPAAKTGEKIAA